MSTRLRGASERARELLRNLARATTRGFLLAALAALGSSGCAEAIADVQHGTVVLDTERVAPLAVDDQTAERAVVALRDGTSLELAGVHLRRDGKHLSITSVNREPWSGSVDDVTQLELQQVRFEGNRLRVQADDGGPTLIAIIGGGAVALLTAILVFE